MKVGKTPYKNRPMCCKWQSICQHIIWTEIGFISKIEYKSNNENHVMEYRMVRKSDLGVPWIMAWVFETFTVKLYLHLY